MIMIIIINCPQAVQAEKYKDKIQHFFAKKGKFYGITAFS